MDRTTIPTASTPLALLLTLALPFLGAALGAQEPPHPPIPHPPIVRPPFPRPPRAPAVHVELTKVATRIQDGVATTDLTQVLRNDGGVDAEATWLLPLPADAPADQFTMTVGGKEVGGEVVAAGKARSIYEEIVRRRRDPGLLEYVGCGLLRARVYPIPPSGTVEVKVRYRQVLDETAGLRAWSFPLRAAGIEGSRRGKLSLDLTIASREPIKNVWSPIQQLEIVRKSDHEAHCSLELDGQRVPPRDLEVFYGVSAQAIGLDLLCWRPGQGDGHFLLMVTPQQDWPEPEHSTRAVQFVLDTSGSMQGDKIDQARRALEFFVASLGPNDLFNVVPFSTEARPFFEEPVPATPENVAAAKERIAKIEARGGTNIEEALGWALKHAKPANAPATGELVPITVFLTDGLPTVGQTDGEALTKELLEANEAKARVFVFGVGDDVNTRLLDKIAADTRGDRDYVRPSEDIEVKTGALFTKLSHPVLTDVALHVDGVEITDQQPAKLPDLFKGSRLVVLGRYRGTGQHAIRLSGKIAGTQREFVYESTFAETATEHDFVATLWAQRKLAVLLDAIRLNGANQELVAEVTRLGKEYAIVTPYTSQLIVEEGQQVAQTRGLPQLQVGAGAFFDDGADGDAVARDLRRAGEVAKDEESGVDLAERLRQAPEEAEKATDGLKALPVAAPSGSTAVGRSIELKLLSEGRRDQYADKGATRLIVHRFGTRVLLLAGGFWVDRDYTAAMRGKERRIEAFSDDYFALLAAHPELAKVLAFSTRLVLVVDGAAIEIVPPAE